MEKNPNPQINNHKSKIKNQKRVCFPLTVKESIGILFLLALAVIFMFWSEPRVSAPAGGLRLMRIASISMDSQISGMNRLNVGMNRLNVGMDRHIAGSTT